MLLLEAFAKTGASLVGLLVKEEGATQHLKMALSLPDSWLRSTARVSVPLFWCC